MRNTPFTKALSTTAAATLALTLVTNAGFASDAYYAPGVKPVKGTMISGSTAPVQLTGSQIQSINQAFNWTTRDQGLLNGTITPSTAFTEVIGLKERTNRLTVQVKSQTQMLSQIATELAIQKVNGPQIAGVARQNNVNDFGDYMGQVEQRQIDARSRIAPSLIEAFDDVDMHTINLPQGVSAETMAEILMSTGDYEFVSIDWLCFQAEVPNDPRLGNQWYHAENRIDTFGAWDYTTGTGEILAVCDSGVDIDHPDLQGALVLGFNAVTNLAEASGGIVDDTLNGHGTLVAGCSAAIGNNGVGISGIGWNFQIMPVKVSNISSGNAFLSDILQGARWGSDNGAYSANCSFGGAEDPATFSSGSHIRAEGHQLVFSSGNDGVGNQTNDWQQVTIVGASNSSDNYAGFSNFGVGVDVIAPGVNVQSTTRTGGYTNTTGTSFASPITAATLMLIHSANPALTANEVEQVLFNSADDKLTAGEDVQTGHGRINVRRAVEDAIFGPSIIDLPYTDQMNDPSLGMWRDPSGDVEVNSDGLNEPSDDSSLNLGSTAQINTIAVRANDALTQTTEINFSTQHIGTEAGENLIVEYANIIGNWDLLTTIESDGNDQTEFTNHRIEFPFLGAHSSFRLRFTTTNNEANDNWYVDDVNIKFFEGNFVPWTDTFENGISLNFDWESSNAIASIAADNEPSGTQSANLDSTDSMTTKNINASTQTPAVYVQLYTQHKGVESGESLLVEYKDVIGNWNQLTTIVSDGVDQTDFELTQLELPILGFGAGLQIRLTAQGDQANDDWYVDNIAVSKDFIVESNPCPADLIEDGSLNFLDVSEFLSLFGSQSPGADFTDDGMYNFLDVSAFLSAYGEGCP
ncbi:MAG: S8 family serine peptidase [Phycisphaerales bacterium]